MALVFDREAEVEAELTAGVRERPAGQGVVEALRAHALTSWLRMESDPRRDRFTALVNGTPALREYWERMWMRHADALGAVIAEELGREADDLACAALARLSWQSRPWPRPGTIHVPPWRRCSTC